MGATIDTASHRNRRHRWYRLTIRKLMALVAITATLAASARWLSGLEYERRVMVSDGHNWSGDGPFEIKFIHSRTYGDWMLGRPPKIVPSSFQAGK